jgi:hypothetical protein
MLQRLDCFAKCTWNLKPGGSERDQGSSSTTQIDLVYLNPEVSFDPFSY